MSHIPEAELHAYLDQALPRLRCVEIESHLAECTPCRTARDEIAALRDRTTAMLARLAPRRTVPPPLADLRHRAAHWASERARFRQRAAWAASVVVALGVGWGASYLVHPPSGRAFATRIPAGPTIPAAAPAVPARTSGDTAAPTPIEVPADETPAILAAEPTVTPPAAADVHKPKPHGAPRKAPVPPPAHLANLGGIPKDGQLEFGGVWRNLSWDGAKTQNGETPARIDGLPVTEVQAQAGDSSRRPLMVVAQQLASGEVIRTIQGPVSDVSALLGTRPGESVDSSAPGAPLPAGRAGLGSALAFRHGDRMFAVTGSLPSDSLRAMMRRLNLMLRVR
jgi:putative zinc finger protein